MIYCSKCGASLGEDIKFCKNCGAAVEAQNTYEETKPVEEKMPSIARAIVSIALGGEAIVVSAISFLYTIMFTVLNFGEVGIVFNSIMALFTLPFAIVAIVLANGYLNSNALRIRGLAKAGKVLGIVSIALIGFSFFISILAAVSTPVYY